MTCQSKPQAIPGGSDSTTCTNGTYTATLFSLATDWTSLFVQKNASFDPKALTGCKCDDVFHALKKWFTSIITTADLVSHPFAIQVENSLQRVRGEIRLFSLKAQLIISTASRRLIQACSRTTVIPSTRSPAEWWWLRPLPGTSPRCLGSVGRESRLAPIFYQAKLCLRMILPYKETCVFIRRI